MMNTDPSFGALGYIITFATTSASSSQTVQIFQSDFDYLLCLQPPIDFQTTHTSSLGMDYSASSNHPWLMESPPTWQVSKTNLIH